MNINNFDSSNNEQFNPAELYEGNMKKSKKVKIVIIITALILAISIIASVIIMSVNSNPTVKLLKAVDKTVFDSESIEFDMKVTEVSRIYTCDGTIIFGEDVGDSELEFKEKYKNLNSGYTSSAKITIKNGVCKTKYDDGDSYEFELNDEFDDLSDEFDDMGLSIDVEEILNYVINKKIDKDNIKEIVEDTLMPQLKDFCEEEFDLSIEGENINPDDITDVISDFMLKGLSEDAIVYEKIDSDNGKSYAYTFDIEEFFICMIDFAKEDETVQEYLDIVTTAIYEEYGGDEFDNAEEIKEYLLEEFEDLIKDELDYEIEGEFTIIKNRLTYFSLEFEDEFTLEININSK